MFEVVAASIDSTCVCRRGI